MIDHGFYRMALFCLLMVVSASAQSTIRVPSDYATIQGAIDAAMNGDTVLVSPGSYTENLDFKGKAIVVTSGATSYFGAAATILNGLGTLPTVTLAHNESRASVLNGFTIQGGTTTAVYLGSSATLSNNAIINNQNCAVAVVGTQASPLVQGNRITGSTFFSNQSGCAGVAVSIAGAGPDVVLSGNLIENNIGLVSQSGSSGGAAIIASSSDSLTLTNNTIRNNAGSSSVALRASDIARLTLVQNLIYNNQSFSLAPDGSRIPGGQPGVVIFHDEFAKMATTYQIVGNTIVGNYGYGNLSYGTAGGEQIDLSEDPSPMSPIVSATIENNLFISLNSNGAASCELSPRTSLTWSNNDFSNAGVQLGALGCTPATAVSAANLEVDAQFLNTVTNDYHTQRTSPVVAAGTINAPDIPATDFDGKNRTVCGTIDMGIYEVHPQPPIALTSAPNPSSGGSSVTLSAHLTGNCNVPTGTVTFLDGASTLGTGVLDGAGNASLSTSALTVGSHPLTVTYPGDFNFDPSTSNTLVQVVTGYPTSTVLNTVAPNPAQALQAITLSATVSSPFSSTAGTPPGTIAFFAGSTPIGSAAVNGNGQATTTVSTLTAGTYAITAVYNATTQFANSTSAAISEVVNGAVTTTALTSSLNPSTFGQAVTFTASVTAPQSAPITSGTVTFRDGSSTLGTGNVSAAGIATFSTSLLSVGSHAITASYGGSANDNASTSAALVQIVGLAPTTVTLTGAPNPANVGSSVALVATVTPSTGGLPTPAGSITFADQFGPLGTVPLSNGQAVLTTSTLAVGSHDIVATFTQSGNYAASTSATLDEVIQAHDFALTLSPATLTLVSGQTGQISVALTGLGSFAGSPTLTAAQIPTYAVFTFAPAQVSVVPGASASSTLSIQTSSLPKTARLEKGEAGASSRALIAVAFTALPLVFYRRRKVRSMLTIIAAAGLVATLGGCSNVSFALNRVAPGTYLIPITATDTSSNSSHTSTFTLIVSP